jgi:hypothetical protein
MWAMSDERYGINFKNHFQREGAFVRILMLTQWFDPEPTFKRLPFANALMRLGHEVEVLIGFPNYPRGKFYEGYRGDKHAP